MTKVINIFGGPGSGKSTTAAGLFYRMKEDQLSVEHVTEYVKKWAWEGRLPGKFDQIYITGKQCKAEYMLYDKVDYVVTDSPCILGSFYDGYYNKEDKLVDDVVDRFMIQSQKEGVEYINIVITRSKPFVNAGRFSNELESRLIDDHLKDFLIEKRIDYCEIQSGDVDRAYEIVKAGVV